MTRRTTEQQLADLAVKQGALERRRARALDPIIGDLEALAREVRQYAPLVSSPSTIEDAAALLDMTADARVKKALENG